MHVLPLHLRELIKYPPHSWQAVLVCFGNEYDIVAFLRQQMPEIVQVLSREILMDKQVLHAASSCQGDPAAPNAGTRYRIDEPGQVERSGIGGVRSDAPWLA
jgi:hypothetical protein